MTRFISVIFILLIFNSLTFAQKERKHIREGNKDFNEKNYSNAEVAYNKAITTTPGSFEAAFNLADALYKQEKYEEAAEKFKNLAATTQDKDKLAKVFHNQGNSYLNAKKLNEAIESYKQSLRNDPNDDKTRYNLAYAQKLLEQQQNQQDQKQDQKQDQQQQDQQQDQQQNQDQQQQNQNQNSQSQQAQNNNDQDGDGIPDDVEKGNEPKPRDTDKDGRPDYQDSDADNDKIPDALEAGKEPKNPQDTDKDGLPDYRDVDSDNDGKPDQPQMQQIMISPEDAKRLLEALENQEQQVQEKLKEEKARRQKQRVEKDW